MWLKSRKHRTEVMMSGANDVKYMVTASHVIKPLYKGEHFSWHPVYIPSKEKWGKLKIVRVALPESVLIYRKCKTKLRWLFKCWKGCKVPNQSIH